MNEEEVLKKIGKENWERFDEFMKGQTVGINPDKSIDYYECDVNSFLRVMEAQK